MNRVYSNKDMKRILRQDIGTTVKTEQKIQEAYQVIRENAAWQGQSMRMQEDSPNRSVIAHRPAYKRWTVLAAAIAVVAVFSITTMALSGVFTRTEQLEGGSLTYQFKVNYELQPVEVEIEAGYIPDGYVQMEESSKWCADGSWQNGISLGVANADYLDIYNDSLNVENVKSLEKATINGLEADLITMDYDPEHITELMDKRIYLFNETDGYVGIVFGGNDLSMEELIKVAEGITYTETGEILEYVSDEEKTRQQEQSDQMEERWKESWEYGVPQEYIYEIGDTFYPDEESVNITVTNVEVIDSAADYPQENFEDYVRVLAQLNEDSTIRAYPRVTYQGEYGGYDVNANEITQDNDIGRKFLEVSVKAQNMGDKTIDFWAGEPQLAYLESVEGDGNYHYSDIWTEPLNRQEYEMASDNMAIYFDQSPYAGEQNRHFYYCDLAAGETLEYTLLFVVDEDRLDNMYLKYGSQYEGMSVEDGVFYKRYVRMRV